MFCGVVLVRLEHLRGAAPERAVHEPLHAADADEVAAEFGLDAECRQFAVQRDRPAQVDAAGEFPFACEPLKNAEVASAVSPAPLPSMS